MKTTNKEQTQSLDSYIALLEAKKQRDFINLKLQFYKTSDHYTPLNIFNRTIKDFRESPETKINLFETLVSISGAYFSKQLIMSKSDSFFKRILGYVLQYEVAKYISKKISSNVRHAIQQGDLNK
jgi:hypothetical protein